MILPSSGLSGSFLDNTVNGFTVEYSPPGFQNDVVLDNIAVTSTSTTLNSSANPSVYGHSVTFTATVSQATAGFPTPTGTVQFQADGVNLGSAVTLVNGAATSNPISSLAAAGHTITAIYSGDPNDAGSSGSTSLTVNQAATHGHGR